MSEGEVKAIMRELAALREAQRRTDCTLRELAQKVDEAIRIASQHRAGVRVIAWLGLALIGAVGAVAGWFRG